MKSFKIYNSDGLLDTVICKHAENVVRSLILEIGFLPLKELGKKLGVEPVRLIKILDTLGLWEEYKRLKKR